MEKMLGRRSRKGYSDEWSRMPGRGRVEVEQEAAQKVEEGVG
jgi:hypothetical protein